MTTRIINAYFKKVPAVVCTAGSYIIAANKACTDGSFAFAENERLFDSMKPRDVLKYESDLNSPYNGRTSIFELYDFHGYRYALSAFTGFLGIRFAVIFLLKSADDANLARVENYLSQKSTALTPEQNAEFSRLLCNAGSRYVSTDCDRSVIDLKHHCRAITGELQKNRSLCNCEITVRESVEVKRAEHAPLDVSQADFVQMMLLCIGAFNEMSEERAVDILLCRYNDDLEVRISADTKRLGLCGDTFEAPFDRVPVVGEMLSLCRHICENAGGVMNTVYFESRSMLTAVLTFGQGLHEEVDFKSKDLLGGFSEDYAFAEKYVLEMCHEIQRSNASTSNTSIRS